MNWMDWYQSLAKPGWTPVSSTISLIWQILYPIIVISFGFVFVQIWRGKLPKSMTLPFAINLLANMSFTPLLFGLKNLLLATLDILLVWSTIFWMVIVIWPCVRWVALAQIPYFVWISITMVLQISIFWMNWGA